MMICLLVGLEFLGDLESCNFLGAENFCRPPLIEQLGMILAWTRLTGSGADLEHAQPGSPQLSD